MLFWCIKIRHKPASETYFAFRGHGINSYCSPLSLRNKNFQPSKQIIKDDLKKDSPKSVLLTLDRPTIHKRYSTKKLYTNTILQKNTVYLAL